MREELALTPLTAISPVDGRYRGKCSALANYFSEYAVIRYRLQVEVEYFIALSDLGLPQLPALNEEERKKLREIYRSFSVSEAAEVKEIEKVTNHDVKAIEYFLKGRMERLGLTAYLEFVHFGLTSQDINNTSFHLALRQALENEVVPAIIELIDKLKELAREYSGVAMLARTHGQPASPTTLGKEIGVFAYRLQEEVVKLNSKEIGAKFGGATGNFNAHYAAYPGRNWIDFGNEFVASLGLRREQLTTQISNYDSLADIFQNLERINTIIIDLDRDVWQYISMNYFKQRIKAGEVGSSAMPHKVNPIDFENSEGNLGIANALLSHLAVKLPISRLQRDLTDSTVLRNIGVPLAHIVIAVGSTMKGLSKLILNREALQADLEDNWAVVAEGIQTILRREGYPQPYEALKALTRTNTHVTRESMREFILGLTGISEDVRSELLALSPTSYIGCASELTKG